MPVPTSRWLLTTVILALLLLGLSGCGGVRSTVFDDAAAPATTQARVTVRVLQMTRSPDAVSLRVEIRNTTATHLVLARHYSRFPSINLIHGDTAIPGAKRRTVSRTMIPERYTLRPGEEATLDMDFAAPGIEAAVDLRLQVDASFGGQMSTWRLALPAITTNSLPTTAQR